MKASATGAQDMTRFAMAPDDVRTLSALVAEIIHDSRAKDHWREQAQDHKERL